MSSTGDHSWTDILTSVAERVLIGDHTMKNLLVFGSVCKAWREASFNVRVRRSLSMPWLINPQFVTYMDGKLHLIKCDLSDFWYKQSYPFGHVMTLPRTCCYVRASKNGWLLISDECHGNDQASILFFFYNPFRNMIIGGLPILTIEADLEIKVSRFTTSPTSPNGCDSIFVICGRSGPKSGEMCRIYTCNVKDKKWICQNITGHDKELRDVLYMNGAFYCVCSVGLSVVMDIFTFSSEFRTEQADDGVEQCGPFVSSSSSSNSLIRKEKDELYLVEADGELLLAVYSLDDTGNSCHIYQYDGSQKEWTRVKSLGNQVMILSSKVGSIVVPAVLDAEQFANMIFVLGSSTYDSYVCKENEGTWKFDKLHDLNSPESCNYRIEPPTLWH